MREKVMLKNWVRAWDKRIADWIEQGPACGMGLDDLLAAYRGQGDAGLERDALPEPYVGDPLSRVIDAVLLMLNPAGSGCEQRHPHGCLVNDVRASSYYSVASNYLADGTRKWWEGRSRWPARLLGDKTGPCQVVGIDLIPWHSKKWGAVDASKALRWFQTDIFAPTAAIAEGSRLSRCSSRTEAPLVLAVGAQHARVLPMLGFCLRDEVNGGSGLLEWPIRADRRPVRRNIRLFVSDAPPLAVLQTDAPGGFRPPSRAFDSIIRGMLGLPR